MITVNVDDSKVQAWFRGMPAKVKARLEQAIYTLSEKLRSHVVKDKLLGQVLNRRSGRLGQSIQERVESSGSSITGIVYSSGDVPYARIQEYGGRTAAHVIEARNAQALSFVMGGKHVFAKRVNHPGSNIPERSYMRSSLADMKDEIIQKMTIAVGEGAQAS
jgi:phage gpG-like protein